MQLVFSLSPQTPGSEFGNDSEMPGPRGLSSRVSVTSHGSGGGFSVKDGAGGSHKTWKASVAGSTLFSHSLINLTQVMLPYVFFRRSDSCFNCSKVVEHATLGKFVCENG